MLLFSVGCAAIMNAYSGDNGKHRDVFKSKYLNVLDFVFGNTGEVLRGLTAWVMLEFEDIMTLWAQAVGAGRREVEAGRRGATSRLADGAGPAPPACNKPLHYWCCVTVIAAFHLQKLHSSSSHHRLRYTVCNTALRSTSHRASGLDAGRIRHYPSNHDILRVASMRIRTYSGRRLADLDREPGAAPGARQAQGQGQGRQLGHRLQNGQSPAGPGTGPGAAAAAAGGGSASAGGLLQALLPASLLQRIGIRGNGAAAAAGTAGPGMRASQSTAMLDQPGEALPAAAAEGQGPATLWRRSFTDPCEH